MKHIGGNIMVVMAFSWHGLGPIVKIDNWMDQGVYKAILMNHIEPFTEDNMPVKWTFVHGNDLKHTSID